MFDLQPGNEAPVRRDNAPPRQPGGVSQNVADGSGSTRASRLCGHLAIRRHLAFSESRHDVGDGVGERVAHGVPKSLSPISPSPGWM